MGYVIDVLLGKADERMQRFGHDKISTFGIGAEHEKSEWQSIFRQLVALNLLTVDGEFGGLKITQQGQAFLKAAIGDVAPAQVHREEQRRCAIFRTSDDDVCG